MNTSSKSSNLIYLKVAYQRRRSKAESACLYCYHDNEARNWVRGPSNHSLFSQKKKSIGEDGKRRIAHHGLRSSTSVLQSSNMGCEGVLIEKQIVCVTN